MTHSRTNLRSATGFCLALVALAGCAPPGGEEVAAELPVVDLSGGPAFPLEAHLESADIAAGKYTFEQLFEAGADLFHTPFNGLDGIGAFRLPDGSPIPRFVASSPGGGAGAPISSQSCGGCHNLPHSAAAGLAQSNVAGDPNADGVPPFNTRSTTSLWGNGLLQLLVQEITEDLQAIHDEAAWEAGQNPGTNVERALLSKGIEYGVIAAIADTKGNISFDFSGLEGVDPDLVVRPLGWKGGVPNIRANTVGAAAGLMRMQAEELVWKQMKEGERNLDLDGDGVQRELSVGDITAMVVYGASQETPQSIDRLVELGLVAPPSEQDAEKIERGRSAFSEAGCSDCHIPQLHLRDTMFEEPTARGNGHYYNHFLAARDDGYALERPFRFDLLQMAQEPRVEAHPDGGAIVRAYGDLKRHHMGRLLADPGGPQSPFTASFEKAKIGEENVMIAATEFLTPELWGVGNTGPWLHDGRAGSLEEAILLHGEDSPPSPGDPGRSEAQESRDAFVALHADDQEALAVFLRNLRTFAPPKE